MFKKFSYFITLIFCALLFLNNNVSAQQIPPPKNQLAYTYDNSGNRTQRKMVILGTDNPTPPPPSAGINGTSRQKNPLDSSAMLQTTIGEWKMTAYPNPTMNTVTLNLLELPLDAKGYIKVVDVSGKIILEQNTISTTNALDFSKQAAGMYYVSVFANNKKGEITIVKIQ